MADMTKKHHHMLHDAVVEGAKEFYRSQVERATSLKKEIPSSVELVDIRTVVSVAAHKMASAIANKLRYTNDNFNPGPWIGAVGLSVQEIWKK